MSEQGKPGPEFIGLEQAAHMIHDGAEVALGGRMQMEPMALAVALARAGRRDLRLLTVPGGGLGIDLLIGAGCVASVVSPQIVLNEFGQAPNFRRLAQEGRVHVLDQV